jgi:hypothetical protein
MNMTADNSGESFGAKPLSDDEPSHAWDLERLGKYARKEHDAIVRGETTLSPHYWRLGQALQLARKQLGRGQWGRYLAELGVHKVRAAKARAIYRTFSTPEAVAGMAVEEAYEQRKRNQPSARRRGRRRQLMDGQAPAENTDELQAFLMDVCARAEQLVDSAAFVEPSRRAALFPLVHSAVEKLNHLGRMLGAGDDPRAGLMGVQAGGDVNMEVHDDKKKPQITAA